MKVVHIESGLGNQMLSYCELLALRKVHPREDFFIETLVYEIEEAGRFINQWNGYELKRIFGIEEANIRDCFTKEQWKEIVDEIRHTEFWNKDWNWPRYFSEAFRNQGLDLKNLRGDFESNRERDRQTLKGKIREIRCYQLFQKTWLHANMRTLSQKYKRYDKDDLEYLFYEGTEDVLTGQRLTFMNRNNKIEMIDGDLRRAFTFIPLTDQRNMEIAKKLQGENSVAVHARRGDLLGLNGRYYVGGFFARAVKYIKKHVKNPSFYFFCDPGSSEWCRENPQIFGLDLERDPIFFVDWNKGEESYRDMQLMSLCKHNIITISSFGWWGAYLNTFPGKITISPENYINTTHHM